jgi:hypothetical protein
MSEPGREGTPPPLHWQVLCLPKHGHGEDEYEDAWAADPVRGRFAVADGASESSFAGRWAQLLTEAFLTASRPADLGDWLAGPRRRWSAEVMGLELPWYAEMKREQGAFATLLGVGVRRPAAGKPGKWRAAAVGDSCVMQVREGRLLDAFPMRRSSDFGNQPSLIGSPGGPASTPLGCRGALKSGDRLLLMTDALAQWFLRDHEGGRRPWDALTPLLSAARPDDAFAEWVEEMRRREGMRNDDVTLMTIELGPAPKDQCR